MGSWGRKDGVELTGTGSITEGTNIIIGTNTLFTEEVELKELIDLDGELYVVDSIIDDTEMVVIPFATANAAGADVLLSQVPKYLPIDVKLGTVEGFDTSGVFLHETTDAVNGVSRELGIKTPGWTQSFTYTNANGDTRRIVETLVAMKQTTEN